MAEKINEAQVEFRKVIEKYKATNPAKYALKKAELEAKYLKVVGIEKRSGQNIFTYSQ